MITNIINIIINIIIHQSIQIQGLTIEIQSTSTLLMITDLLHPLPFPLDILLSIVCMLNMPRVDPVVMLVVAVVTSPNIDLFPLMSLVFILFTTLL